MMKKTPPRVLCGRLSRGVSLGSGQRFYHVALHAWHHAVRWAKYGSVALSEHYFAALLTMGQMIDADGPTGFRLTCQCQRGIHGEAGLGCRPCASPSRCSFAAVARPPGRATDDAVDVISTESEELTEPFEYLSSSLRLRCLAPLSGSNRIAYAEYS